MGIINKIILRIVLFVFIIHIISCTKISKHIVNPKLFIENNNDETELNNLVKNETFPISEPYGSFDEPIAPQNYTNDLSLVPVIVVDEGQEIKDRRTQYPGSYANASVVNHYAPLPVFFEGYQSTPRERIVDYIWDFGDGSERKRGFNTSHIYETPGVYTARLYIVDKDGKSNSSSIQITVRARDGKTYYVDSEIGKDTCNGLSKTVKSETICPWKSAYQAFSGMLNTRYQNGEQILFKRGQVFFIDKEVKSGHYEAGYGYLFGAYGEGHRPIIQYSGTEDIYLLHQIGKGAAYITIQDLDFRCNGKNGSRCLFYRTGDWAQNILIYRVAVSHGGAGSLYFEGYVSGAFIHKTSFYDSEFMSFFTMPGTKKLSLFANNFDLSGNHIAYISGANSGVIARNRFTRAAFGRHALRLCYSSEHVYVARNYFAGWKDPVKCDASGNCICPEEYTAKGLFCGANGRGTGSRQLTTDDRYNWLLVHIAPNSNSMQNINDIVFESNVLLNAETMLNVRSAEDIIVRNNIIISHDTTSASKILVGNIHGGLIDLKPAKNIKILGNTIWVKGYERGGIFGIKTYDGPEYNGRTKHEQIEFSANIAVSDLPQRFVAVKNSDLPELSSDYNLFYLFGASTEPAMYLEETSLDFSNWQTSTGLDLHSKIGDPRFINFSAANNTNSTFSYNSNMNLDLSKSAAVGVGLPYRQELHFDFNYKQRNGTNIVPGALN